MTGIAISPRVLGHCIARVLTEAEIAKIGGAHGGGCQGSAVTGIVAADLCCDGTLTGTVCGDNNAGGTIDSGF